LKGVGLADAWPSVMALVAFVVVITALAILRYRTTLD
jgi:ABC-2 type transport system permease protein